MEIKTTWAGGTFIQTGTEDLLNQLAAKVFCHCGGNFNVDVRNKHEHKEDSTSTSDEQWELTYFICQKCKNEILVRRNYIWGTGTGHTTMPDPDGKVYIYNNNGTGLATGW